MRLLREQHRRLIRKSFETWCIEALIPLGFQPAAHHRLLINKLQAVAEGRIPKLMVNMPPGSAKSTYGSWLFPAWFLARAPYRNIVAASHTTKLAEKFSGKVQGYIRDNTNSLRIGLSREAVANWSTTNGGEYLAAGVGMGIAGFRADLGLIDDPVRAREQADSEVDREKVWNWYTGDFMTRLKPGAPQIIIMTRWHEDDLGGRILLTERDEWDVVTLRAIADENDPLGRRPGEMLWTDDDFGYGAMLRERLAFYERVGGMRDWSSLYQQDPRPRDGALFKTARIGVLDIPPTKGRVIRAWDLASTKQVGTTNPDWTVGVKMLRTPDGGYVVLDVVRFRGGPDEVEEAIVGTAKQDGRMVPISLPQDPGQAGKTQVLYLTRKLTGFTVSTSPETGDKETRASPYASQVNVGNVSIVRASWNAAYLDELSGFPSATKDDQVDASSRAFGIIGVERGPMKISADMLAAF